MKSVLPVSAAALILALLETRKLVYHWCVNAWRCSRLLSFSLFCIHTHPCCEYHRWVDNPLSFARVIFYGICRMPEFLSPFQKRMAKAGGWIRGEWSRVADGRGRGVVHHSTRFVALAILF